MTGQHEIATLSFWQRLWAAASGRYGTGLLTTFIVLQLFLQFGNQLLWDWIGAWAIAAVAAFYVVALGTLVVVGAIRNPSPVVDFDAGVLRIGSEETPFAEVTEAWVAHLPTARHDDLYLSIGGHRSRHAFLTLRGRRHTLNERDREVLAVMVERSGIHLPPTKPDPYDPTGKFAWLDQQGYLTKEQTVGALLRTPATGDVVRS